MSFLVTGGTGFIGSYVVRCLLQHGERVVGFDRAPDTGSYGPVYFGSRGDRG